MSKINLSKNKVSLENAWHEVTKPESKINWAVFGYDGKSFDLKVTETGEDGFEEMVDEFNGGKIMYAVCRVNDPNTNLPKLIFVNWQGEGVPANIKGVCANHLRDVTNFFKGCHVTINARSESDLDYDSVLDKVKKSSGANYSIHKEKPKPVEQIKPVGAVYKKINPMREIDVNKRDTFWSQQETEERNRLTAEKDKAVKQRQEEEVRRKEREAKEAAARDQMVRERTKSIEQQRASAMKEEQKRRDVEKQRYQDVMKEKEKDDQEFRKRSDSERRRRLQEAQSLISHRPQSIEDERKAFTTQPKGKVPPPTKPKAKAKTVPEVQKETVSPVTKNFSKPSAQEKIVSEQRAKEPIAPEPVAPEPVAPEPVAPVPIEPEPVVVEPVATSPSAQEPSVPERSDEPAEELSERITMTDDAKEDSIVKTQEQHGSYDTVPGESLSVSAKENTTRARALYDYQAEGSDEISFDPGDIIEEIDQFDEGWWRGKAPNGQVGIFPSNFVEILEDNSKQVSEDTLPAESETIANKEETSTREGLVARAIYDYQAEGDDEISFDPGDLIEELDQFDEGWWRGKAPNGKIGIFPSNYVELIDQSQSMGSAEKTQDEPHTADQSQGIRARALYDYQASDETEISFDPDDIIVSIEQIDEGWWRGTAPNGSNGLFPANYVEVI